MNIQFSVCVCVCVFPCVCFVSLFRCLSVSLSRDLGLSVSVSLHRCVMVVFLLLCVAVSLCLCVVPSLRRCAFVFASSCLMFARREATHSEDSLLFLDPHVTRPALQSARDIVASPGPQENWPGSGPCCMWIGLAMWEPPKQVASSKLSF